MNDMVDPKTIMLAAVRAGGFDADVWQVMQERDTALITEELMYGSVSDKMAYNFAIQGTTVAGLSVIGARHLMASYGGLEHRIIASVAKRGSLFVFQSYPNDAGAPMRVEAKVIPELATEPDHYRVLVEVRDRKSGNSVQQEHQERFTERRRDGTEYERPHAEKIAQSKAYRNAVLSLLPQDFVQAFLKKVLQAKAQQIDITEDVIEQRRAGVISYATKLSIPLQRTEVSKLAFSQLDGLSAAAKEGPESFKRALAAVRGGGDARTGEVTDQSAPKTAEKPKVEDKPKPDPEAGKPPAGQGEPVGAGGAAWQTSHIMSTAGQAEPEKPRRGRPPNPDKAKAAETKTAPQDQARPHVQQPRQPDPEPERDEPDQRDMLGGVGGGDDEGEEEGMNWGDKR